ncbi:MAG: hypothetical protein RLN88_01715 [Ekhidna sp.]|uniref:hypothetical protein n=1 Tax=Ekhidna sp. TaxID=2608089 RepID=UPI0032EAA70A
MEEGKKSQKAEQTPKWLKTIQLNSWEAELLISALVLYALYQVPDYIDRTSLQHFERGSQIHNLASLIKNAVRLLSFGYILHILVRGVWVASVGLSYVFPGGVNQESLKFKGKFRKELSKSGSLVKMVLRLEELSSIIYGISFIFFGTLVGFGGFIFSFIFAFELIQPLMESNSYFAGVVGILILFYFFLALLVFIDFLTNGWFRRMNWSADWFYYVALFFRVVTLSFLYRRSLLVLISNTKGWKSYLIPIIVLGITGGYMWLKNNFTDAARDRYYMSAKSGDYNSANYESTRDANDFLAATIQSDIINDNTLKIFLKDMGSFGGIYFAEGKSRDKNEWHQLPSDSVSALFDEWLNVQIDDNQVKNVNWFKTQHPTNFQFGFTAFIDIKELERGPHFLRIGIDTTGMKELSQKIIEKDNYSLQTISNIYFIYDKP